jgi:signal transduction histidine kinase
LLLLAESDSGSMPIGSKAVALDQLAQHSVDMFRGAAEERGLELSAGNLNPTTVLGDAGRLRQVVNNLIDNSLKFTPAGGRIRVALLASADAERIVLRVSDTGEGIAAEDLPHVFDRFYRGDKSRRRDDRTCGNGLGLSICQSIVAAHEGEIRVESTVGEGSVFEVALPAALNGQPEPADAAPTVGTA